MQTSQHVQTKQALNRSLEMLGLPSVEITETDFLQGAIIEAQNALYAGNIEQSKRILREALKD